MAVNSGVAGQVNLVVSAGGPAQFWDGLNTTFNGVVNGGSGTWNNFATNFSDAGNTRNEAWLNGTAIFTALSGTVTLGDNIVFQGIQFSSDGYTIVGTSGFTLQPTGTASIITDPAVTATITAPIAGAGGLDKGGSGTLILSGNNTYLGGTTISDGILSVASDTNLGATSGGLTLNGGELETTAVVTIARTIGLTPRLTAANILAAALNTTATYTGAISGTGGLTVGSAGDTGTVVLSNIANSYAGGTTVSNGATLSVGDDLALGDLSGGLTLDGGELLATANNFITAREILLTGNNGALAAEALNSTLFTGIITGVGNLTIGDVVNTGTVRLGGTSTYSGSTIVLNGVTLQALSNTALSPNSAFIVNGTLDVSGFDNQIASLAGASTGIVTNGDSVAAVLTVGDSTSTLFNGVLRDGTDPLGLIKVGSGTLTLTGENTYSFGTTISAGTLQIGNGGATGSIVGDVVDNATLTFNRTGTVLLPGDVSGTGILVQAGPGTTVLTGANTYSGGTIINAGILQIGNGGLTGSIAGNVADNGQLVFNRSDVVIFAGLVSGTGGLTQNGGSALILTGENTYTGGTTINPGSQIVIGNGGITGSIVGNVDNEGSFAFRRSDSLTFSGLISGPGNVIQDGTGTTILSGRNTYSGGTLVESGTLLVNNHQALGTGNVTIKGGVLGADPQPINVLGNYTQNAGGTLQLNIAGRSSGQFDTLNVTGTASLNGNLRLLNLGYQPANGDKLQLIAARGVVSGRFSAFQNPFTLAAGFDTIALVYARNSVTLEFLDTNRPIPPGPPAPPFIISTTDYASFALTFNQTAVGNALNAVQRAGTDPALVHFLAGQRFAKLPGDLEKISPESLSAIDEIGFSAANVQASNLEERFAEIRNGSNGFSSSLSVSNAPGTLVEGKDGKTIIESGKDILVPSLENKWGVWVSGNGDYVNVSGDGNGRGYDFITGGVSFGLDYRLTKNLAIGIAGSYAHTWTNLTASGKIDADGGKAGVYAAYFKGGLYLSGYAGGGYNSYSTRRDALGGFASGSSESGEFDGYIGGGYDFHYGAFTVGPTASLQYTYIDVSGNDEAGSLAPLRIQSKSQDSLRSNVGLSASYTARIGKVVVTPSVRASWQHEYSYRALPVTAQFGGGVGEFTVYGSSVGQDSAIINAGVNVQWTPTIGTYFGYNGQLGRDNYDSQGGTCSVHWDF